MSQGFQGQLGIDTVNPVTLGYEFASCQITKAGSIIDSSGIRGGRSHHSERTRQGNCTVEGLIELYPSPADLSNLLPLVLGGTPSGTTYPLADSLTPFFVTVDKVANVFAFAGVKVNKATFSGSEGAEMKLDLDLIGTTAPTIGAAGSFPSGTTFNNTPPLMFADTALTLLSVGSRLCKQWTLAIDNMLDARYANSTTVTSLTPKDRIITFNCQTPFTSAEVDLFNQAAGAGAVLELSNSPYFLTFTFGCLQFPPTSPKVPGRSEIMLDLTSVSRSLSTTPPLAVTLATS